MKLQTLYLKETQVEKIERAKSLLTKAFWKRQFQVETTKGQKIFDWAFGVILPVVYFCFDPIVFKSNSIIGKPLIPDVKPFAFILSFVSIIAIMAWLLWGAKLKWLNAFLAGLFFVGGIISFFGGIGLMPFSAASLFMMGLTPMFTIGFTALLAAFVYLRNSYRAFDAVKPFVERSFLFNALFLSALLSVIVPMAVNRRINKFVKEIVESDAQTIRAETESLKSLAPLADFDVFRRRYKSEDISSEEKKALAETYRELTGESLEKRIDTLNRHRNL